MAGRMYICELCHKQQPANTPCKRIVVQTRNHHHPFRSGEPPFKGAPSPIGCRWEWSTRREKWIWHWYNDPGGRGTQIVKEVRICPDCAYSLGATSRKAVAKAL